MTLTIPLWLLRAVVDLALAIVAIGLLIAALELSWRAFSRGLVLVGLWRGYIAFVWRRNQDRAARKRGGAR